MYEQEVRVVSKLSRSWSKAARHSRGRADYSTAGSCHGGQLQIRKWTKRRWAMRELVDKSRYESGQNADPRNETQGLGGAGRAGRQDL